MNMHKVSVIIPAKNAEATLPATLASVFSQDYRGPIEVIVADGSDTSATADLLCRRYPQVQRVPNPEHITPTGLNHALRAATGKIIVRCDSASVLPPDYVRQAVATLARTGAANVGGQQCAVGTTMFERAVALATTTFLGTGGARYRMGGPEGPTDTVYLGVWYRETLENVQGFDPAMFINEDYELNWRLRQQGETVWFDPLLKVSYQPRSSLWTLAQQYLTYGRRKSRMLREHPNSLLARQLAAPLLVLGLVVCAALTLAGAGWAAAVLPLVYLSVLIGGALAIGLRRRDPAAVLVPLVLAAIHLSWGVGFFLTARKKPTH